MQEQWRDSLQQIDMIGNQKLKYICDGPLYFLRIQVMVNFIFCYNKQETIMPKKYRSKRNEGDRRQEPQHQRVDESTRVRVPLDLKQILILWIRKLFPPRIQNIKTITHNQQFYLQGQEEQIINYIKKIQHQSTTYKSTKIYFKSEIMIEKIQHEVEGLHGCKIIRPNMIKIVVQEIIKNYNLNKIEDIKNQIFIKGDNLLIVCYFHEGEKQLLSKIDEIVGEYEEKSLNQSRMSKDQKEQVNQSTIKKKKKYKPKQANGQRNNREDQCEQSRLQQDRQTRNGPITDNNNQTSRRRNLQRPKIKIFVEKINKIYFHQKVFNDWVVKQRNLQKSDFTFEYIENDVIITLLSYQQNHQKVNAIKRYLKHQKLIMLKKWQQKCTNDLIIRFKQDKHIQIEYKTGYLPPNTPLNKILQQIKKQRTQKNTINTTKFYTLLIRGIVHQVQRIQKQILDILKNMENNQLEYQIYLELNQAKEYIRDKRVQNLIEGVLKKQLEGNKMLISYKIVFAVKEVIVKVRIDEEQQHKYQGFKQNLNKFIQIKIKVKKYPNQKFSQKIIAKFKQKYIIIQNSQGFVLIQEESKITDIIDQMIKQSNNYCQAVQQKIFKCDIFKLYSIKQMIQKLKNTSQKYKSISIITENQQNNSQIRLIGSATSLEDIQIQIKKGIQTLQKNTLQKSYFITEQQAKILSQDKIISSYLKNQFNVQMFVRINVQLGAQIKVGQKIKIKILKGMNNRIQRLQHGSIFLFRNKNQLDFCKEQFLLPLKLQCQKKKQSNKIQFKEQIRNIKFIYKQNYQSNQIIPICNDYIMNNQQCKIGLVIDKKNRQQMIKCLIKDLMNLIKKNILVTILEPNQTQNLQKSLNIKFIKGVVREIKWYTLDGNKKYYYSQSGILKINKAIENHQKQVYLDNNDLNLQVYTHQLCLSKKIMKHTKSQNVINVNIQNNRITFSADNKLFQFPKQQYLRVLKGKNQQKDIIEVSIGIYKIDIQNKNQTNVFSGFKRKINQQIIQIKDQFNGQVLVNYDLKVHQVILFYQNLNNKIFTKAWNYVQDSLKKHKIQNEIKLDYSHFNDQTIKQINSFAEQCHVKIIFMEQKDVIKIQGYNEVDIKRFERMVHLLNNNIKKPHTIQYPKYWQKNQASQIQLFNVLPNSQEFIMVSKQFKISQIKKLQRIQNKIIYKKYFDEKQFLKGLNKSKDIKQMMLFHGTKTTNPQVIYNDKEQAFNINYTSDKNLLGKGIYFAQRSEYSNSYASQVVSSNGILNMINMIGKGNNKQMFYCLVLVGQSQKCLQQDSNIKDTNFKNIKQKLRYESMTAFLQGSNIYVVYKNRRAYPLYLITY